MLPALKLLLLSTFPMLIGSPEGSGESGSGSGRPPQPTTVAPGGNVRIQPPPPVVLVKSASVRAVQEVADAFSEGCRVHVQQVYIGEGLAEHARVRELGRTARVLVAVGQPAIELMVGVRAQMVYALAPDPPPGIIGTNNGASPHQVFRSLLAIRPRTKRIVAISSERGSHRMAQARAAVRSLGIELFELSAENPGTAIRELRKLFVPMQEEPEGTGASPSDALWLGADPQLIDTQVLQFALQMQIQRQVPVVAATRQQVSFGALLAVDWALEAVGRHLAWQVNQLLDDPLHVDLVSRNVPGGNPESVVNAHAAQRLGIPLEPLRHANGWKVIER